MTPHVPMHPTFYTLQQCYTSITLLLRISVAYIYIIYIYIYIYIITIYIYIYIITIYIYRCVESRHNLACMLMVGHDGVKPNTRRYSLYLLYGYKRTNTDAAAAHPAGPLLCSSKTRLFETARSQERLQGCAT
jgi:hypothetical protein